MDKQMKAIVAVTKDWGIGRDNQLLVSIPEDMKFFRTKTAGAIVIMGRKTLESFPGKKPLKNRVNIVVTRDRAYAPEGVVIAHDVEEARTLAMQIQEENLLEDGSRRDIYVIGGASIYKQMADMCDTIYVTKLETVCKADAYFPNLDNMKDWYIDEMSEESSHDGIAYRFVTYKKH